MTEYNQYTNDAEAMYISQLITGHLHGNLTAAQQHELNTWIVASDRNKTLFAELCNDASREEALRQFLQHDTEAMLKRVKQLLTVQETNEQVMVKHPGQFIRWLSIVAVFVVVLATALYFYMERNSAPVPGGQQRLSINDVAPGGNKATLTLADGSTIELDSAKTAIRVNDDRIKYDDGTELKLRASHAEPLVADAHELRLATPYGGQYQIILPDGSKVWLNAASTLKYPSSFTGKERIVEVSGEAYFVIKEDSKHPFKVISEGQEIAVLGTEFNVSAYQDDPESKTTLVTGSVQVTASPPGSKSVNSILSPGQQATKHGATIDIKKVDVTQYTAWKDGFFYFDRAPTQAAITQLARWYDLDVVYKGKLPEANIFASIDRNKPLSAVLKSLEKSGLKFKVSQSGQRRQLIVLGEQ